MHSANICTILEAREWKDILGVNISYKERDALYKTPKCEMLSVPQLEMAVGKTRAAVLVKKVYPILAEINADGKRRCLFIFNTGVRCTNYTKEGMCMGHMKVVGGITNHFRSKKLRDTYESFLNDPRKMQLNNEQAMLRLLLSQLIDKVADDKMPIQLIEACTVLCDKIATMTLTISKINQLTPDVVDNILTSVIEIMADYLPPEKLEEAANKVKLLTTTDPDALTPITPGSKIEVEGIEYNITTNVEPKDDSKAIQIRALVDEYKRLEGEDE